MDSIEKLMPSMNMITSNTANVCPDTKGLLPACAPLANPYVPFQQEGSQRYEPDKGLNHGTLFPGLYLPFKDYIATHSTGNTPMDELMALDFALVELALYLDTHSNDAEAFELYKTYIRLMQEGRKRYVEMYGPLVHADMATQKSYTWLKDPWPWNV